MLRIALYGLLFAVSSLTLFLSYLGVDLIFSLCQIEIDRYAKVFMTLYGLMLVLSWYLLIKFSQIKLLFTFLEFTTLSKSSLAQSYVENARIKLEHTIDFYLGSEDLRDFIYSRSKYGFKYGFLGQEMTDSDYKELVALLSFFTYFYISQFQSAKQGDLLTDTRMGLILGLRDLSFDEIKYKQIEKLFSRNPFFRKHYTLDEVISRFIDVFLDKKYSCKSYKLGNIISNHVDSKLGEYYQYG